MSEPTYTPPAPIYLIMRVHHGRDTYNYSTSTEELADEYGFFTTKELAQEAVDSLGPNVEQMIEDEYQLELKAYRKQLKAYEKRELELTTLRAAGIKPSLGSIHKPAEPKRRGRLKEDFYTSYEIMEVELNGKEWP